jgi:hypothetical protein
MHSAQGIYQHNFQCKKVRTILNKIHQLKVKIPCVNPIEDAHVLDKVLFKVDAVILILPDDDSMILKSNDRVKICRKETLVIIF